MSGRGLPYVKKKRKKVKIIVAMFRCSAKVMVSAVVVTCHNKPEHKHKYMKQNQDTLNKFRAQHHAALETLRAPGCTATGLQLWRKCRQLEAVAHAGATALCNGETFAILDNSKTGAIEFNFCADEIAWNEFCELVASRAEKIFGRLPAGFFVNGDARGYALKLDPEKTTIPAGMHQDWGRNGILAAEIN
jgi:hypothetical protein